MSEESEIKVKHSGIVKLTTIIDKDGDGDIYIAEAKKHVPFNIKRVFFISHPKKKVSTRGKHAHKKIKQAIFCINGSFVLNLDDGTTKQSITLDNPSTGVLLGTKLWHTMTELSAGCNIMVLSDSLYIEEDNIRDYDEFLKYISKKK